MQNLKYILLLITLSGTDQVAISQYYLKSKSDSISLESDSVLLFIDEYKGTINWQASTDLVNWFSLNKHEDTLGVRIDKSGYYRAKIVEGTCNPVMSDTVYLIEKMTLTNSNQFTVDKMGGVFLLPSGIKVKIPKGAVTGPKEIRVDTLSFDSIKALANVDMPDYKSFLAGVSIATDTFNFSKPVKIKIPLPDTDGMSWLFELNKDSKDWLLSNEVMLVGNQYMNIDKSESFVEIIFNKSEQKNNDNKGVSQFSLNDIRSFFLEKYGDIFWAEDPCRQGIHKIESGDMDKENSGGCTLVHTDMVVRYTDCKPEQAGQYVALSLSADCQPSLICPGSLKIKKGESVPILITTEFNGFATIGSFPLSQQNITLSPTGSVSVNPSSQSTDDQGHASFSVTGNIPGEGKIKVIANFKYFLNTLLTTDNGKMEYEEYDPVPEFSKECTIDVTVFDVPEVTTSPVTDISCKSATVGGNVVSDGNGTVTDCGMYLDGVKLSSGSSTGSFKIDLLNLTPNTTYSVKAYATNIAGTGYGVQVSFTTLNNDECNDDSKVSTAAVTDIGCTSATVGGNVTSDEVDTITERGVYWGTSQNPESTGTKVQIGSGTGSFSSNISGLNQYTTYYVKAYATKITGMFYGDQVSFATSGITGTVTDIEGNTYPTVTIGTQVWMAENLKTTRYNNGVSIATTIPATEDITYKKKEECAFQWAYDGDENNVDTYGRLYTWYVVSTGQLCPTGWHVPSLNEWDILAEWATDYDMWSIEKYGGKLKEIGNTHWISPNSGATNETCFTALPGGIRVFYGDFFNMGYSGDWWTTHNYSNTLGYNYSLKYNSSKLERSSEHKKNGNSVRCVKD